MKVALPHIILWLICSCSSGPGSSPAGDDGPMKEAIEADRLEEKTLSDSAFQKKDPHAKGPNDT